MALSSDGTSLGKSLASTSVSIFRPCRSNPSLADLPRDEGGPLPPKFSVILVHYQGVTDDRLLLRGIDCILNQVCQDYELILMHNGPLLYQGINKALEKRGLAFNCLDKVYPYGYESRHQGMLAATGDYIVHFNSDNELYPEALAELHRCTAEHDPDVIIFPIWITIRGQRFIMSGFPPVPHHIDCMQGVVRRHRWVENGGWTERTAIGDGVELAKFVQKFGYTPLHKVLGEHH